jgi:hypothetical protein
MANLSSYLACIGNGAEDFRSIPITGTGLIKTIVESQRIPIAKAKTLLSECFTSLEEENRAFMKYYPKQFSQKLRQKIKMSELFDCRTFKQLPIKKLYLSGRKRHLDNSFNSEGDMEIINVFDILKNNINANMSKDEISLFKEKIGAFLAAAHRLREKQMQILGLFSVDFRTKSNFSDKTLDTCQFLF